MLLSSICAELAAAVNFIARTSAVSRCHFIRRGKGDRYLCRGSMQTIPFQHIRVVPRNVACAAPRCSEIVLGNSAASFAFDRFFFPFFSSSLECVQCELHLEILGQSRHRATLHYRCEFLVRVPSNGRRLKSLNCVDGSDYTLFVQLEHDRSHRAGEERHSRSYISSSTRDSRNGFSSRADQ